MIPPPLRSLFRLTPGICFGTRQFSEPALFPPFIGPIGQGLYVILVHDNACTPRPFRHLYLGESSHLSTRLVKSHEKYDSWIREANRSPMYFAYHPTPGMTDQQRQDAERELINHYRPPCNDRVDSFWHLVVRQRSNR